MSGMSKGARYSQSRTDTLIGAGVRVNGNVDFTGVLRIQGNILGKVACDLDSSGTVVVGKSGNITGTIKAPHIVVGGHVHGPVSSSESIEIQHDACLIGDADYKTLEVHAGGVIEGALTPRVAMDMEQSIPERRDHTAPAVDEYGLPLADAPPAGGGSWQRWKGGRKLGLVAALLVAVIALVSVYRGSAPLAPAETDVVLKADSSMQAATPVPPTPAGNGGSKDGPKELSGAALTLSPGADADTRNIVQAPAPGLAKTDSENVEVIQGVNPGKPAGVLSVIAKETSVLFRKERQEPGDGTRIDISRGATENIAIAKNEIFRVAQGPNMIIYFQGRKVALKIIENGSWMSFVPHPPESASDKR